MSVEAGQEIWSFVPRKRPEKGTVTMRLCIGMAGEYESLYECVFVGSDGVARKNNLFASQIYTSKDECMSRYRETSYAKEYRSAALQPALG